MELAFDFPLRTLRLCERKRFCIFPGRLGLRRCSLLFLAKAQSSQRKVKIKSADVREALLNSQA
jgi:hypothetical protein